MSDSSTAPPNETKTRLPMVLLAVGVVALMILALSLGGLTWWLVSRSAVRANVPPEAGEISAMAGSSEIFNGRDLDGWDFDPDVWSVCDGVISGHQRRGGYGSSLFWRNKDITDFELHFRFRLVRGNSGVYYRASQLENFDVGGYEFEIYTNKTGNLADNGTDRVKRRLHVAQGAEPVDSEWHEAVIIAAGPRLVHRMDGKVLCDVEDTEPAALRTGAIAFSITSSTIVEFKDIRLKQLPKRQ
jgi:hypothetical protein